MKYRNYGWNPYPARKHTHPWYGTRWYAFNERLGSVANPRHAQEAYRKNRENGEERDNPTRALPLDGKTQWVRCHDVSKVPPEKCVKYGNQGDGYYKTRYDAGPGDTIWMEEKDRNYLTRLIREGKHDELVSLGGLRTLKKHLLFEGREKALADFGEEPGLFTSFSSRLEKGRAKLSEYEALVRKYQREHVELRRTGAAEPSDARAQREAEEKARHAREAQEEQRREEAAARQRAEQLARGKLEQERLAREKAEQEARRERERLEAEAREREAREKVEQERLAKEKAEAKAREKAKREQEARERQAQLETERRAQEVAEQEARTKAGAGSSGRSDTPLSPATPLGDDLPQIRFADLALGEKLGEGGFGIVQKARWLRTDVAVKRLKLGGGLSPEAQAELLAEARLMYQLQHPNIVRFIAVCAEPANPSMILKYMSGGSLYSLLKRMKDLAWAVRLKIAHGAAAGLEFLHSRGIIHRDLKTMNVLLNKSLKAKLTDFGLSRVKSETASSMKMTGGIAGTPAWLAPENVSFPPQIGKASDVYALGTVMWSLSSFKEPYDYGVSDATVIINWIREGKREAIPEGTPESYAAIIQRCWEKDPAKRPSAGDVATQLEALMKTMPNSGSGAGSGVAGSISPAPMPAVLPAVPSYASHALPQRSGGGAERLDPKPSPEPSGPSYR